MLLLDETLALNLLTADQHTEIGAWVRQAPARPHPADAQPTCGRCWKAPAC